MSDWLTLSEAAEVARVHMETMRRWAAEKKVRHSRAGRHYRFKKNDIDRALEMMGRTK